MTITVFDESGTSSTPGDRDRPHEFACAGIMVSEEHLPVLRRLHVELVTATSKRDFKFSDVRKSHAASRLFQDGIGAAQCAIIAMYGFPGSVALEQDRFDASFERQFGPPPNGFQTMKRRTHQENLMQFVRLVAGVFLNRTHDRHRVYWDARSDGPAIETAWRSCIEESRMLGMIPGDYAAAPMVVGPPNDLKFLARLAGVVAGDVVSVFQHCGDRLRAMIRPAFVVPRHPRQLIGHQKVADGSGDLVRPGRGDEGPQRTLFRGYYRRLLNQRIFFFDPEGRACGLRIVRNHIWELHQVPDRAR